MASKTPIKKKKKNPVLPAHVPSEKIYRTIFDHDALPAIIFGKDLIISDANRKFSALSGYRRRDIEGKKTWTEFVLPGDIDAMTAFLSETFKKKGPVQKTYPFGFVDKVKRTRDMVLSVEVIPTTRYIILSLSERVEEPQKSQARGNHQQMSAVIYNIPEATFATDQQGNILAWNRAIEELTGSLSADILGKGDHEYSLPFFNERRSMIIDLIFASDSEIEDLGYTGIEWTGNTLAAEITVTLSDGQIRVIREIASPIFNEQGKPAGAIESITDVTGLRQREIDLQVSESRYRTILENTGSALAIIEEDDTISYLNPEFEKIIGYVREEVEGRKKLADFVAPKDFLRLQEYERKCRTEHSPETTSQEFLVIRYDGYVRNGFLTITPIPDTKKMVVSLIDITHKSRKEDALQKANTRLNTFNFITRHEILNHLTVVKGYIELSREQIHDPLYRLAPFLLTFLDKELAAANAIQNLITFTRDYQNIGIRPPVWNDLTSTINLAAARVRLGSVTLTVDTGGVEIYADFVVEKVFFHLIDNAVRFGGRTSTIRFSCKESFEELLVICEDDGVGIKSDAKEKIFARQLSQHPGLDMHLAREILGITGITIKETGMYDKGARFEIRVPEGAYRFTSPH
jgi:PAS domain S-box-containing protein